MILKAAIKSSEACPHWNSLALIVAESIILIHILIHPLVIVDYG
jgi:hypothetical protein